MRVGGIESIIRRLLLDDGGRKINLQILPPTPAMANLYTSAAMAGAFAATLLPLEVRIMISAGLTRADAARSLVRVNRAASKAVKIPEVLQRDLKTHSLLYHSEFISQHKLPVQIAKLSRAQATQGTISQPALKL